MLVKKRIVGVLAVAVSALMLFSLAGCSKGYDIEIGSKSDNASYIDIKNDTSGAISGIEFSSDSTVSDISNNLMGSDSWENGKTARVYAQKSASATILVKISGTTKVLHNVDISSVEKATLKLEGDYAYLEYEKDGKTVSTLDDEKAYVKAEQEKKEAEAKAKAEAEQKAKEEQEAKEKAEQEAKEKAEEEARAAEQAAAAQAAQAQSQSSSTQNSGSGSQSSSSGSGNVQQSTDGCLGGAVK